MFNNNDCYNCNVIAALCLSAFFADCEIACAVAFKGEVRPSACSGMP